MTAFLNDPATGFGLGLILGSAGWLIILLAPVVADFRDERAARKAERIVAESPEQRRQRLMVAISTPANADSMDRLLDELLATPRVPQPRGAVD